LKPTALDARICSRLPGHQVPLLTPLEWPRQQTRQLIASAPWGIAYADREMQRLTARPWFRRRRVGLGWRPVSSEGWAVTVLAVALAIGVLTVLHGSSERIPIVILILAAYAILALVTGGAEANAAPPASDDPASAAEPLKTQGTAHEARPTVVKRREPPASSGGPALVVEQLTKRFGERIAVEEVSFSVAAGEVFGFLGPKGEVRLIQTRCTCAATSPRSDASAA
jgi:hypothetical protein